MIKIYPKMGIFTLIREMEEHGMDMAIFCSGLE